MLAVTVALVPSAKLAVSVTLLPEINGLPL
jgi:hypothetical protein